MRLVAVSIVKNEADIIEPFVRHTLAWVDHHLIFDHDSTDGTREILLALKHEGLPLTLYTDDDLGNLQQARSNHLTRLAAQAFAADWILPLDADEILTGPDRATLEACLARTGSGHSASWPLLNYYPTTGDTTTEQNPVLRVRHCQSSPSQTRKIVVPRQLAIDRQITAGKGSHRLYRGDESLPDQPLPGDFCLAHLALRSPQHQVLRVVLAELQKLSRGEAHAGLDTHYRLGFQLLAEDPDLFFATIHPPVDQIRLRPIPYRGSPPRYYSDATGWNRVSRALLPFLGKLAASHGRLVDGKTDERGGPAPIRELPMGQPTTAGFLAAGEKFSGFIARRGWGDLEGPVPEAFLPPFHWGMAPATHLTVDLPKSRSVTLTADILTYSENQTISVMLNGIEVGRHVFSGCNQKERLLIPLTLDSAPNEIRLNYSQSLVTSYDPRRLAVIFFNLQIRDTGVTGT